MCTIISVILALTATIPLEPLEGVNGSVQVVGGSAVIAGDPMLIELRMTNGGKEPVSFLVPRIKPPNEVLVGFDVMVPGSSEWRSVQHAIHVGGVMSSGGGSERIVQTLAPGEFAKFEVLFSGWHYKSTATPETGYVLRTPGEYKVRARILMLDQSTVREHVPSGTPMSWFATAPTTVRVVLPASETDRAACAELLATYRLFRIYAPWYAAAKISDELAQFRERHAQSRYFKFTEMQVLFVRLVQAGGARDKEAARAIHAESLALIERARNENWPPGWIAIAEELERQIRPFAR